MHLKTKSILKKGLVSESGDKDENGHPILVNDKWRCGGTPSVDGPNDGCSAGTAVAARTHVGITVPQMPCGLAADLALQPLRGGGASGPAASCAPWLVPLAGR